MTCFIGYKLLLQTYGYKILPAPSSHSIFFAPFYFKISFVLATASLFFQFLYVYNFHQISISTFSSIPHIICMLTRPLRVCTALHSKLSKNYLETTKICLSLGHFWKLLATGYDPCFRTLSVELWPGLHKIPPG